MDKTFPRDGSFSLSNRFCYWVPEKLFNGGMILAEVLDGDDDIYSPRGGGRPLKSGYYTQSLSAPPHPPRLHTFVVRYFRDLKSGKGVCLKHNL